jgi:hypothetical protein
MTSRSFVTSQFPYPRFPAHATIGGDAPHNFCERHAQPAREAECRTASASNDRHDNCCRRDGVFAFFDSPLAHLALVVERSDALAEQSTVTD